MRPLTGGTKRAVYIVQKNEELHERTFARARPSADTIWTAILEAEWRSNKMKKLKSMPYKKEKKRHKRTPSDTFCST